MMREIITQIKDMYAWNASYHPLYWYPMIVFAGIGVVYTLLWFILKFYYMHEK